LSYLVKQLTIFAFDKFCFEQKLKKGKTQNFKQIIKVGCFDENSFGV
jgi:hypothetical protein